MSFRGPFHLHCMWLLFLISQFFGFNREESLIFVPRNPARVSQELSRWFGGRVPPSGVIDVGKAPSKRERRNSGSRPGSAGSGGRPCSGGKSGRPSSAGKKRKQVCVQTFWLVIIIFRGHLFLVSVGHLCDL